LLWAGVNGGGHDHIAHKLKNWYFRASFPDPTRIAHMTTKPTEPLAISQPDQLLAALDNLLAFDLITRKQARVLSLLVSESGPITIERVGNALHVRASKHHLRITTKGLVRYL
jgi:hypothetical protein